MAYNNEKKLLVIIERESTKMKLTEVGSRTTPNGANSQRSTVGEQLQLEQTHRVRQ